jgi:DNA primase
MNPHTHIDLIALIESDLGQGQSKQGGRKMLFHCPFPGHTHGDKHPSLDVINSPIPFWKCWACGKQGSALKWLMEYRGLSYADALKALKIPAGPNFRRQEAPIQQPDNPPGQAWQVRAWAFIEWAESVLWSARGKDVLAWLRSRGLSDESIRAARLGYIPMDDLENPEVWGTPNDDIRSIYFYAGLLIPGIIGGKVWYLKMRPAHPHGEMPKYLNIRGSKSASLYGADCIVNGLPAIFCEGELDAILLRQEVKELASVMTLGSATNELNVATWGIYLVQKNIPFYVIAYDVDSAGNGGANKLSWLHAAKRLHIPILRKGDKDLTDFHKSGGNLYSLIESVLRPGAPIFVTWPEDAKPITIRDQYWRMPDNKIEAFYLPRELDQCLEVTQLITEPELA